ncbi:MAG: hypothetical protein ACK4E8_00205 [Lacibacter sp.]
MKQILFPFLLLLAQLPALSQKYSGQWTGSFDAKGDTARTEYVLEIEAQGNTFEGTSITYFTIGGQRFYTICAIKGTIDPGSKTLVSTEVKKVKGNTPPWFRDCFQTHTLTYFKKGQTEQLVGTWKPANPEENCGTGTTLLERKALVKNTRTQSPAATASVGRSNPAIANRSNVPAGNTPANKPAHSNNIKPANGATANASKPAPAPPPAKTEPAQQPALSKAENKVEPRLNNEPKPNTNAPRLPNGLEQRDNRLFETIVIHDEEITISLYDNAEVDGDVITVLFNDEVVVSKQTLSDKPITVKLKAIPGRDNTLVMYAENQGRIPPNTAIMRVQSGEQYYKILLSADDKRNASVIFRFRK